MLDKTESDLEGDIDVGVVEIITTSRVVLQSWCCGDCKDVYEVTMGLKKGERSMPVYSLAYPR